MCLTTYLPFCTNIHANRETKGDISCTPPPSTASDANFPTCGESNYTSREKWNIAGRRKEPKLKRILLLGYRLSLLSFSFLTWCCPLWWEEGANGGGAYSCSLPLPQCPSERKKGWGCFPRGHQGCPNINYTFVHLWLTLEWPRLTSEWKRSSKTSPLPQPIPCCQQTAHGPLTHCQPNETSALMKPLWALLVRRQRAMKTLTIHFMDWAVVRTDNMGLINETGLVSWRKRRGIQKCNWWRHSRQGQRTG